VGVERECASLLDSTAEITPKTVTAAERRIYRSASPETRCIYEIAPAKVDNWIIRWMLWYVMEERSVFSFGGSGLPSPAKSHGCTKPALPSFPREHSRSKSALPSIDYQLGRPNSAVMKFKVPEPMHCRVAPVSISARPHGRDYWDPIRCG